VTRGARLPVFRGDFNKFHAQRTTVDGQTFDSKGEAIRWGELQYLEKAGEIFELRRQVAYDLHAGDRSGLKRVGRFILDFEYLENVGSATLPKWRRIVEDFKGARTPLYLWKKKHLEAEYNLTVRETSDGRRR